SWLPIGKEANACQCIGDSVKIDVSVFDPNLGHAAESDGTPDDATLIGGLGGANAARQEADTCARMTKHNHPATGPDVDHRSVKARKMHVSSTPTAANIPVKCFLCPNPDPELPTGDGGFAHRICADVIPDTCIVSEPDGDIVLGISAVPRSRFKLRCQLCGQTKGACIQCCKGKCTRSFHGTCIQKAGLKLEKEVFEDGSVLYEVICPTHDPDIIAKKEVKQEESAKMYREKMQAKTPVWGRIPGGQYYEGVILDVLPKRSSCKILFSDGYKKVIAYDDMVFSQPPTPEKDDEEVEDGGQATQIEQKPKVRQTRRSLGSSPEDGQSQSDRQSQALTKESNEDNGFGEFQAATPPSTAEKDDKQDPQFEQIISQFDATSVAEEKEDTYDKDETGSIRSNRTTTRRPSDSLKPPKDPERPGDIPEQPFDFNRFLEQMRKRSAIPITRYFKSFLREFDRRPWTVNEQIKIIQDFLEASVGICSAHSAHPLKCCTEQEFDNAKEGMEKLVMNRLYSRLFSPTTTDDRERDAILHQKIYMFKWVTEAHLDIPVTSHNESFLKFAQTELLKINNYKAPRDKLICVLNCCKVIFGLIRHVGGDAGADKFLPILIYVVLKANPPRLVSNVQYIQRFRNPDVLQSEAGYYLTNLMAAISFIETLEAKNLSISEEEFNRQVNVVVGSSFANLVQRNIEEALKELEQEKAQRLKEAEEQQTHSPRPHTPLSAEASLLLRKGTDLAQRSISVPLNFVGKIIQDMSEPQDQPPPSSSLDAQERPTSPSNPPSVTPTIPLEVYEERLATLHAMFPNMDADVCEVILQANNNVLSQAIETLLDMSNEPKP
ncbi:hypothetical protein BZG36_05238, partial [Bifiguratus adelaidae]